MINNLSLAVSSFEVNPPKKNLRRRWAASVGKKKEMRTRSSVNTM